MFKKVRNTQNNPMMYQPNPYMENPYQMYDSGPMNVHDVNHLVAEINELKRQNVEMLKRITKIENFLGIKDYSVK